MACSPPYTWPRITWSSSPGNGYYAHRDGYNVLYGDWSVRWYGDPQQKIMYYSWTREDTSRNGGLEFGRFQGGAVDGIVRYRTGAWEQGLNGGPHFVWHDLDAMAGIDLKK